MFDNSLHTTPSGKEPILRYHQLFIANIDGSDVRQLTDDAIGASQPSWSPDGSKVVYLGGWAKLCCWRNPADLMVLDLRTGMSTTLAQGRAEDFDAPSFSLDGSSVNFARWPNYSRPDLWTIPAAEGGRPEPFLDGRGAGEFSPDGTKIVYGWTESFMSGNCGKSYGVAWISDADGSDPRRVAPEAADEARSTWAAGWSPDGTRIAYSENLGPPDSCTYGPTSGAYVMDVETGDETLIAFGQPVDWVDDRTLLVRGPRGED